MSVLPSFYFADIVYETDFRDFFFSIILCIYLGQSLSINVNDQTALMTAAQRNNGKAVKLLLKANADLSIEDKKGILNKTFI